MLLGISEYGNPLVEQLFGAEAKQFTPRADGPCHLLEQDLCHHPFVFMIQQMTMEYRHAFDDRIGEVQDHIKGTFDGNVHSVQPQWLGGAPLFYAYARK